MATVKVKCIECKHVEWIPAKQDNPLGPCCSKCMGTVVVVAAKS